MEVTEFISVTLTWSARYRGSMNQKIILKSKLYGVTYDSIQGPVRIRASSITC